ncbi:hypothetical protein F4811DRAFT_506665 [Daldinia bambusicola]|nr:hypothetical protein F4811DRAFT_506665 [Daldinia bambusicola]
MHLGAPKTCWFCVNFITYHHLHHLLLCSEETINPPEVRFCRHIVWLLSSFSWIVVCLFLGTNICELAENTISPSTVLWFAALGYRLYIYTQLHSNFKRTY